MSAARRRFTPLAPGQAEQVGADDPGLRAGDRSISSATSWPRLSGPPAVAAWFSTQSNWTPIPAGCPRAKQRSARIRAIRPIFRRHRCGATVVANAPRSWSFGVVRHHSLCHLTSSNGRPRTAANPFQPPWQVGAPGNPETASVGDSGPPTFALLQARGSSTFGAMQPSPVSSERAAGGE